VQNSKLANRYSKALLDLALERNALDAVNKDMKSLVSVCESSRDLQMLLKSPIIKTDKKIAVLLQLFDGFHALSKDFISLISRNRRESDLYLIAKDFNRLFLEYKNIQQVVITSAAALDVSTREKVLGITIKATNSEIELIERINPSLIGGFVLRIGDIQLDTSIATKIRRVRRELIS